MSAATEDPPVKAKPNYLGDVAAALSGGEVRAADLLDLVGERALTIAWTGGYVEFGHREYSVTGNPDNQQTQAASELHVESGETWTGPKRQTHCTLRLLLERGVKLPHAGRYKRNRASDADYKPAPDVSPLTEISRTEAESLVYLKCRLTDKGHQLLLAD